MRRVVLLSSLVLLLASPAHADRLAKGRNVLWVGLNGNTAQLLNGGGAPPYEGSELGVHAALNRFLSDAWTVVLSGGFDAGNTKTEQTVGGGGTLKLTSTSFNVRLGGDRYAFINDDVALYAGPGILFWKGHGKFERPGTDQKLPDVTQVAFNGRIGMYARLGGHTALFGHIGQVLGMNSGKDPGFKYSWWSNHHEGSVGLAFDF